MEVSDFDRKPILRSLAVALYDKPSLKLHVPVQRLLRPERRSHAGTTPSKPQYIVYVGTWIVKTKSYGALLEAPLGFRVIGAL